MGLFDFFFKKEELKQSSPKMDVTTREVAVFDDGIDHDYDKELGIPAEYPETVRDIHREFLTSSDNLLREAYSILEKAEKKDVIKGNRLNKLGFRRTAQAERSAETMKNVERTKEEMEYALYYKNKYPLNKFITKNEVKRICEKYGLACAPVSCFTGFVPEKNLIEIENFKGLSEGDKDKKIKSLKTYGENKGKLFNDGGKSARMYTSLYKEVLVDRELKICAPKKDLDLRGLEEGESFFFDENVYIPDPVVLTHCKGGFLILTAWGPEASDPLIVNEINN